MITEDYVSFEVAKLLKEKGFNENTEHKIWYVIKQFSTGCHWNSCTYKVGNTTREYNDDCCIPMPTLQMAMKWLREVHCLHITVHPGVSEYGFVWTYAIVFAKEVGKEETHFYKISQITTPIVKSKSYEQACESAIKYCLENLI